MDIMKLLEIAGKLNVPGLVAEGIKFIGDVKKNAAEAKDVLSDGDQAELDAVHERALEANSDLDAKLAEAAKR